MKIKTYISILCVLFLQGWSACHAHEQDVHRRISESAFLASSGIQSFLKDTLDTTDAPFNTGPVMRFAPDPLNFPSFIYSDQTLQSLTPIGWISYGSWREDGLNDAELPFLNHFYAVGRVNKKLTDHSEESFGQRVPDSTKPNMVDSFTWTSMQGGRNPFWRHPYIYTCPDTRTYQFKALTENLSANRNENIARMLHSLGHVLHLNQDLSSPDHVRNDEHKIPERKIIEPYGQKAFRNRPNWFTMPLNPTVGRTAWRNAGFNKLEDFWDRKKYAGNNTVLIQALYRDAWSASGQKLGLAEFTQGNFLGEDAVYSEYFPQTHMHYFPFPSRDSSTDFAAVRQSIISAMRTGKLQNGQAVQRLFLAKVADGIPINNHSVLGYLQVASLTIPTSPLVLSQVGRPHLFDNAIMEDYLSVLLPKAVEYSTGILDYFFRGQIDVVEVKWNTQLVPPQYTIKIRNKSGQDFGAGKFIVLKDDASGNRSYVTPSPGVPLTQVVADNAIWEFNFPGPQINTLTKLYVVYQGNIGLNGGDPNSPIDPVDAGIAIAAKPFQLGCPPAALVSINETITYTPVNGCPSQPVPPQINNTFSEMRSYNDLVDLSPKFPLVVMWNGVTCPLNASAPDREHTGGRLEFGPYPTDTKVYAATPIKIDDYFTAKLETIANPVLYQSPGSSIAAGTFLFNVPAGNKVVSGGVGRLPFIARELPERSRKNSRSSGLLRTSREALGQSSPMQTNLECLLPRRDGRRTRSFPSSASPRPMTA